MVKYIVKLYKEHHELTLLEISYAILLVISFVIAAILALFNHAIGTSALIIPLVCLVTGIMNVVAWSLIKMVAEHLISTEKAKQEAEKTVKKAEKTKK